MDFGEAAFDGQVRCRAVHDALLVVSTVTLRSPRKSSKSRAILWLLSSVRDHKVLDQSGRPLRATECCPNRRWPRGAYMAVRLLAAFGGAFPPTKSRNSFTGSAPSARVIAINSITSIRRSPPSYLATKDCGRPSFLASACCLTPEAFRTATRVAISRAYSGDLRDFCMRRQGRESAANNLIPTMDYPKKRIILTLVRNDAGMSGFRSGLPCQGERIGDERISGSVKWPKPPSGSRPGSRLHHTRPIPACASRRWAICFLASC